MDAFYKLKSPDGRYFLFQQFHNHQLPEVFKWKATDLATNREYDASVREDDGFFEIRGLNLEVPYREHEG